MKALRSETTERMLEMTNKWGFNRLSSSRNEYLIEADHAGEMETKLYKALQFLEHDGHPVVPWG